MRKWSVDEFCGLVRHQLTDTPGPVELVAGEIVPLSQSDVLTQQVLCIQQQMQQALSDRRFGGLGGAIAVTHPH